MESNDNFGVSAEMMVDKDISPIRARFGDWLVTDYGIECLDTYYPFEWHRIDEDWHQHMAMKNWVNMRDFDDALEYARDHREYGAAGREASMTDKERIVALERGINRLSWRLQVLEGRG